MNKPLDRSLIAALRPSQERAKLCLTPAKAFEEPAMNAYDFYAQSAREQQESIDASHAAVAKKIAEDWAALKNRLAAYVTLTTKPYEPDPWILACIADADTSILMVVETKEDAVENCNIDD